MLFAEVVTSEISDFESSFVSLRAMVSCRID